MSYIQTLSYSRVKKAAQRLYKARKLMAQHRERERRHCLYKDDGGYRCAIGAGLSQKTLERIGDDSYNLGAPISGLSRRSLIKASEKDLAKLLVLQRAHDDWCKASSWLGGSDEWTVERRQAFVKLLYAE